MEKILKYLEQLDLSEIEAKLYLTLLQTGPNSVRDIANAIGIKRTTAYLYVDQLEAKGLLIKIVQKSHPLIEAVPPESSLEHLVKEKVENTQTIQSDFPTILQSIHSAYPSFIHTGDAEVKYYKGINNARKIYEESLNSQELRAYVKIKETEKLFPDNLPIFENAFKNNPRLKVWEIIYDSASTTKDAERVETLSDKYFYKFMPGNLKLSSEDILIYDGKVAIINYRGEKTSVVLHSSDFYNNLKAIFDFTWNMIPSLKGIKNI
ncbi:MAG TPA: helix-turn-helix domain-containing protein [Candidatus Saccharimonadales bacterium]|nr:helix-turn-helix domain-containing protein [Candidatus Saccharimonadales bacterium]